jgi:hypothetical protein
VSVGSTGRPDAVRPTTVGVDEIEAVYRVRDDAERNRLITETYSDLSRAMRALIGPHASWCTFSTWSSRTVGYFIRGELDPLTEYRLSRLPRWLRRLARKPAVLFSRSIAGMRKRSGPRLLARGNREIYREIAAEFARFVETFGGTEQRDDQRWDAYRAGIQPTAGTELFPPADIELVRSGMYAYYRAMFETDMRRQAELVLLGNILLADYEQQRVDPIVRCALSLFPSRILDDDAADDQPLVQVHDKKPWALQDTGPIRGAIDRGYSWLVTKARMAIVLPSGPSLRLESELIRVGYGLPKPKRGEPLYPSRLSLISEPELLAVWEQHDRAHGEYKAARADNWTVIGDRMNCIVNVFRARQARDVLYTVEPLTLQEQATVDAILDSLPQ